MLENIDGHPYFATLYAGYEAALRAAQAVDFDDLILRSVHMLQTQPQVLAAVQEIYR